MNPRIAIIDKCPSRNKYENYFPFEFTLYHLSSKILTKVLKKDVDIDIDENLYDYIILVGSEAAKHFAKASVTNSAGVLLENKYLCITNPAALIFKPEGKPEFERTVKKICSYIDGTALNTTITGDFKGINDTKEAVAFFKEVLQNAHTFVAWDTEDTALYPRDGHVLGISMSYKVNHGRYVSSDCIDEECLELLQQIIDKFETVFHNLKFDWKMLEYHMGLKFDPKRSHDTMVEHYVLDESEGTHGLKLLAIKHTNYGNYDAELTSFIEQYCATHNMLKEDFNYGMIPFDIISRYAAIDTAATLELHYKFFPIVMGHPKLSQLYTKIMIPSTVFLTEMEEAGIPMSVERLKAASAYLNEEIDAAKTFLYTFPEVAQFEQLQGKIFNPGSVVQLRSLLFDFLGLTPTGKLTGTGAISTDAEVLEILSEEHPIPKAILQIRKLTKIRSTYIDKIIPELDRDNRVRTNFNNTFTTSGRLSSSGKFNAQQIPRDNPIIKGCIQAKEGWLITQQD